MGAFDDFTDDAEEQRRKGAAGLALRFGVEANPDRVAQQTALAQRYRLPLSVVQESPDEFANRAKLDDAKLIVDQNARLQAWLAQDSTRAAIAHDDVGSLGAIERITTAFKGSYLGASTLSGVHSMLGAVATLADDLNPFTLSEKDAAVLYKDRPEKLRDMRNQSAAMFLSRFANSQQAGSENDMAALSSEAKRDYGGLKYATTDFSEAAYLSPVKMAGDVIQSLPTTAALMLSIYFTKGAATRAEAQALAEGLTPEASRMAAISAAATTMARTSALTEGATGYAQQKNQAKTAALAAELESAPGYQDLIKNGYTPEAATALIVAQTAQEAGLYAGAVDAATNLVGGRIFGKIFAEGGKLLPRTGKGFLTEGATELVQSGGEQAGQNLAMQENVNPHQSLAQDVVENMVQGLVVGGITGGGFAAIAAGRHKATVAADDMAKLQQLGEAAAASKLRERDPGAFKQFIEAVTEDGHLQDVYIDGKTLVDAFNQSGVGLSELQQLMPGVSAQLNEALQTEGAVRIPTADYATHIAGGPVDAAILPHLKADPNGMTYSEAQVFHQTQVEQLQVEATKILAERATDEVFKADRQQVFDKVLEQLTAANRFVPDVNQAYATLVRDFYVTTAEKLGVKPSELYEQYPLRVAAQPFDLDVSTILRQDGKYTYGEPSPEFKNAIDELLQNKSGDAQAALYNTSVGAIDVIYGEPGTAARDFSDGYGLAHILAKHPEIDLYALEGVVASATEVRRKGNTAELETPDHRVVIKLDWQGETKKWLLTAFEIGSDKTAGSIGGGDLTGSKPPLEQTSEPNGTVSQTRGAYNPQSNTIALLKNADLSTFLHETGHHFLELTANIASRPDAPAAIRADMDALLRWFGVKDADAWRSMTLDQQRQYHEQFARGFETYLFEGAAPSVEIQGLFSRFRAWLLNVYKSLAALKVELTDEVRGVMGRMLASEEAIRGMEQVRGYAPIFKSAEAAGMTPEQWAEYQQLGVEATERAVENMEQRSLREMRWLANAKSRALKELQKEAASKRREVRAEVEAEVTSEPVYQAQRWLKRGEMITPDGEEIKAEQGYKLNAEALRQMYPEGSLARPDIGALHGMVGRDGMHPDAVAEIFGFSSGDALVRSILDAESVRDKIEGLTDQRMLERYGELSDPQAIERAAEASIHNEARARFVATELKALTRAQAPARAIAEAARVAAETAIAAKRVRDVRPAQYTAAEAKAARNADKALAADDVQTAAIEKRAQLLNNRLARAAGAALEEVRKGIEYLKGFEASRKTLDADYADQIDGLLERFDLRKRSLKEIDKRATLAAWLESQREMGFEPDIPQTLENEAFRQHYKNLTVEQFRGLVDTVRQIEHLGRLKHKLLTARDQRAYEAVRDEIAASIEANARGRAADTRTPTTATGRAMQGLKRFWAAHRKAAMLARQLDGEKDGGPMWEYFVRSANERGDMEATLRADATRQISGILAPVFELGRMGGSGQAFPGIERSLNREARLAIALNTGNEGNLQRLLGGEGWTVAQIQPVLNTLTAAEWQAVQAIWDHFETYRPQIAAKERRVYGKEPAWVAPTPFTVRTADGQSVSLRGGYYPIKYDPAASQRAEEHADAEGAKRQLQGAYTSATTRRSFTKARAEEVTGRPLLYSLAGLYSGVNDVIHDLAWHEWLIDANRLMRSQTIDGAIREHYGPEVKTQFKTWIADVAEGERGAANAGEAALSRLRQGVSAAGLGFNVMNALMQPLGVTQSIVRVGAKWMGRGIAHYIAHPIDATREANEKSDFMANRARTRFRELNELRNKVQDETAAGAAIKGGIYFLMMRFQQAVDVPTWWGAYEKAVSEGNEDSRAIALADQAVIDSQGGGMLKDLSAIERGGSAQKLFTVFYSFMNTAFNLGVNAVMSPASRGKKAADLLMIGVVPPMLAFALKQAITPGGDDDWDMEKLARELLAAQIDYLMGLMVIVREFAEAGKQLTGANDFGRDYTGPAGVRLAADSVSLAKQAHQGEFDDAFRKAAINVVGDMFGLPSAQANRTVTGVNALVEGETSNPAAILFGYRKPH